MKYIYTCRDCCEKTLETCHCLQIFKFLKYILGFLIVLMTLQYGFNMYVYVQYDTITDVSNHVRNVKDSKSFQKVFTYVSTQIKIAQMKKLNKTASSEDSGSWISRIKQQLFSTDPVKPVVLDVCPKGPYENDSSIVVKDKFKPIADIEKRMKNLGIAPGGIWKPKDCIARYKIAIIVPYRDRIEKLSSFLQHMHPFLQRQNQNYRIYIVEQSPKSLFNRGLMMNVGFKEAMEDDKFDCVVLHDLDMLPENDRILYDCPKQPMHLVAAGSRWNYRLPYNSFMGGVTSFTPEHYRLINGFSNIYFGWGAEDDDLYKRVKNKNLKILRYPLKIGRYRILSHKQAPFGNQRMGYLNQANTRFKTDGLNDLDNIGHKILKKENLSLYTRIVVDIDSKTAIKNISRKRHP